MPIDGGKLRELRLQKGMSQEKLAAISNLNKRTIQRAEGGEPIALESLAFIADSLEVQPKALRSTQIILSDDPEPTPVSTRDGEVILVPVTRGTRLVNTLREAFHSKFEYEAEPTEENVEQLQEIAVVLNTAWQNPWEFVFGSGAGLTDVEVLHLQARANKCLSILAQDGIRVFMATYPSWVQIPRWGDEGMYVYTNQRRELVQNVVVVVSGESATHLARMPSDHEALEEIPF